jgi:hypothetical protein
MVNYKTMAGVCLIAIIVGLFLFRNNLLYSYYMWRLTNTNEGAMSVNIVVAFFKKIFLIGGVSRMGFGVASSLGNVKGRDERCAVLRALDIANASGWCS